ncbi:MAG TPA: hypothetical protein VL096_09035 [Pirellulaceae bacterium]|nr:hypothetical protein [Pirellulaceae bacterium]
MSRSALNGLLALALFLMLAQTMPGTPQFLEWRASWLANKLGLWQQGWSMFAPDPDSVNHHIRAIVRYYDGRVVNWDAPTWKDRSLWRKFTGARELEYFDSVEAEFNSPALPGLADYLARELRTNPEPNGRPKRVELWIDVYFIPHPKSTADWQPIDAKLPLSKSNLMYVKEYE